MLSKNPSLLDPDAQRLYLDAMREAIPLSYLPKAAAVRPASQRTVNSPIIGQAPQWELQNQHDPIKFSPMLDDVVSATMKRYGAGVELHEDDWEDDQLGAFMDAIQDMGNEGILLPNALLIAAITSGQTALGWDGSAFFTATHAAKQDRAAWSNLGTGTGVTAAQVRSDLDNGIEMLLQIRSLNGRQINSSLTRLCIIAPVQMRAQILEATQPNNFLVNNASLSGVSFDYIFDADLGANDANNWVICNTSSPRARPFVWWERRRPRLVPETANAGVGFANGVRRYKGDLRGTMEYGLPEKAVLITNT